MDLGHSLYYAIYLNLLMSYPNTVLCFWQDFILYYLNKHILYFELNHVSILDDISFAFSTQ